MTKRYQGYGSVIRGSEREAPNLFSAREMSGQGEGAPDRWKYGSAAMAAMAATDAGEVSIHQLQVTGVSK